MVNEEMACTRWTEGEATEKVKMEGTVWDWGGLRIVMGKSHYEFDPCKYFRGT